MLVHSFYVIRSKCCYASDVTDFGDFVPAPELVTKHPWLGDLETITLAVGCSGVPNLYFYLLQSPFLWVSLYLPLTKHLASGQCIFNPHQ